MPEGEAGSKALRQRWGRARRWAAVKCGSRAHEAALQPLCRWVARSRHLWSGSVIWFSLFALGADIVVPIAAAMDVPNRHASALGDAPAGKAKWARQAGSLQLKA
ncbi:hypothetical protein ABPG75_010825 [Micractinium tetrahymenae]